MKLIKGECITEMNKMDTESINLIICDLPYGTIDSEWDAVINPNILFEEYKRILKPDGTLLLFGSEPFSTSIRNAGMDIYRYDHIWIKSKYGNHMHAKNRPLKNFEIISVFSKGTTLHEGQSKFKMTYNPQGLKKLDKKIIKSNDRNKLAGGILGQRKSQSNENYEIEYTNYPKMAFKFDQKLGVRLHPTQKPTELYEYLIRTYSNSGDVILDNCAGSGTLGAAGLNIPDRDYIMIELEPEYQDIIIERLPDIEVIEGSQEVYKPVLTVDRIKELAIESKGGMEFNKMLMDENLDATKLLKEYKVKSIPQLRLKLRKEHAMSKKE